MKAFKTQNIKKTWFFKVSGRVPKRLGASGDVWGASWGRLGASWERLGRSWGRLGGLEGRLGRQDAL